MRIGHLFYETTHEIGLSHGCDCSAAHEMGGGRGSSCDKTPIASDHASSLR